MAYKIHNFNVEWIGHKYSKATYIPFVSGDYIEEESKDVHNHNGIKEPWVGVAEFVRPCR